MGAFKKYILTFVALAAFSGLYGQYTPEEDTTSNNQKQEEKLKTPQERSNFLMNLMLGGDINIYGSYGQFFFEIGPKLGYRLFPFLTAGVGLRYQFYTNSVYNYNSNVYGGGAFISGYPINFLILHAEYERLNLTAYNTTSASTFRTNANVLFLGLGYRGSIGKRFHINTMLLYDALNEEYSPFLYLSPNIPIIYRVSFEWDIF